MRSSVSAILVTILMGYVSTNCLAELRSQKLHHDTFSGTGKGRNLEQIGAIKGVFQSYGIEHCPPADFAYHLLPNGTVDLVQVQESEATPCQNYYYEQSIWEAAPFQMYGTLSATDFFELTFDHLMDNKPSESSSNITELSVIRIHLIPASVLRLFPDMFTREEISGTENQVTFDSKYSHSPLLQMYRTQWSYFLATNPKASKVQIQQEAADLKKVLTLLKRGGRLAETLSY